MICNEKTCRYAFVGGGCQVKPPMVPPADAVCQVKKLEAVIEENGGAGVDICYKCPYVTGVNNCTVPEGDVPADANCMRGTIPREM